MKISGIFIFILFFVVGCTTKNQDPTQKTSPSEGVVNLAIWANYISPEAQAEFTKETGIKINISNFSSNEELLAKVQSGNSGYDVIVPSDYMVDILIKSQLLLPLKKEKLTNIESISTEFLKQDYDTENKFSLPYSWSTAGIAYNTKLFKGTLRGWKDVFNDPALEGKISLLDDVREVMAVAFKMDGKSINSKDPKEIEASKLNLIKLRKKIKMFRSDTIDILTNGEVLVAHSYSTDSLQAMAKSKGEISYIIPEEGATRSIDNLAILKESKNQEQAHQLVNFLLSKKVNLQFVKSIFGGPILKDTKSELPLELQNNTSLFPSPELFSKLEKIKDLGDSTKLYDKAWTEIKSE